MKYKILFSVSCLLIISQLIAQKPNPTAVKQFVKIVNLIKQDRVKELSNLIAFPIRRDNPVPDIENKREFVKYYPILFDQDFKQKLDTFNVADIFQIGDNYGIFDGDLWMNAEGKLITVNYQSKSELSLAARLTSEERGTLFPSIRQWKLNMYKCLTEKYLFRVDETEDGIRLALWKRPNLWKNKPDLILIDYKQNISSGGNEDITFKNGDWTYLVSNIVIGGNESIFGVSLSSYKNDLEQSSEKCKCIK